MSFKIIMTSLRKRLSAPKEMFVAVKYSKPYEKYPNDVFSAKCITHLVVGPKPAPGADRPKVPYQHSPGVGFASGMLYVIRTDRDALDNKMHDYYVYIGAWSESEEDLRSILADETRSGELSWPPTIEDTSELESGCESDEKSVRDGRVLNQAINNSKDLRLARQQSHQNHLSALKSNSHLDLSGPNTGILSDPGMTLENLRKQAKEQAEIIKKMEEESQRRKEEDKRRAEELSQKEEALRKKEEELNANIKRIDSVFVCIQNLQSDVSLIKEKISKYAVYKKSYVHEWVRNLPIF
ncbi:hypothetical protein FOCC_FOCC017302 [Frankliniella occidentalis]|nr:hypothetical protein FOCC_FOCC017302 [Frankliniella occidentalis]